MNQKREQKERELAARDQCPRCAGTGTQSGFICTPCDGTGRASEVPGYQSPRIINVHHDAKATIPNPSTCVECGASAPAVLVYCADRKWRCFVHEIARRRIRDAAYGCERCGNACGLNDRLCTSCAKANDEARNKAPEILHEAVGDPAKVYEAIGRKDDDGKAKWHLLPLEVLGDVVDVLAHGAKKYGERNWQNFGDDARDRYYNALMRHLVAWHAGETNDRDSGLPHLAHALCNLLFLRWYERQDKLAPAK